jgi:hypothetical protein
MYRYDLIWSWMTYALEPVLTECQSGLHENNMDNDNLNLEVQQQEVNLMNETSPNTRINYHQNENNIPHLCQYFQQATPSVDFPEIFQDF